MGSESYKNSGVDTEEGQRFVDSIKPFAKKASRPEVLSDVGGFAGMFALRSNWNQPVLVSGADGVGTKLAIAKMADKFDTIGIDLVAMCVNDVVVSGAEPLFFLDYLALESLSTVAAKDIVKGVADGCMQAKCALLGGETAEMPGLYRNGDFDVAGFCVGIVERDKIVDRSRVRVGDAVIGVASSGLHSNGYSLVRKIFFEQHDFSLDDVLPDTNVPLGQLLLEPTRIYVQPILSLLKQVDIHAMAHITGGGFFENIPRVLPDDVTARIEAGSWPKQAIFHHLKRLGNVPDQEMFSVFNSGIGLVLIVPEDQAESTISHFSAHDMQSWQIGEVEKRTGDSEQCEIAFG